MVVQIHCRRGKEGAVRVESVLQDLMFAAVDDTHTHTHTLTLTLTHSPSLQIQCISRAGISGFLSLCSLYSQLHLCSSSVSTAAQLSEDCAEKHSVTSGCTVCSSQQPSVCI